MPPHFLRTIERLTGVLPHCRLLAAAAMAALAAVSCVRTSQADPNNAPPQKIEAATLPFGFAEQIVATGIDGATSMAIASDGRVFICEQTGALRVIKDHQLLPDPFVSVEVDSYWERGLIGVALDPGFEKNGFVYVCYISPHPHPHHRISRFTAHGDRAIPGSELILFEGDDQTRLGGSVPAGHQGGALGFGNDGKLYVAIGEQTAATPSQRIDSLLGKILRIDPDGSIPQDNPFYDAARGKYRAIWARGLRNPFAIAFGRRTGRMFINDVGSSLYEEINEGFAGANYGWPENEGATNDPRFRGPLYSYAETPQKSITGGVFYEPAHPQFPARFVGKYFFADYAQNWIRVLDPDNPAHAVTFATGLKRPVDLDVAPDGSLYYLNRNVWIKDGKYVSGTGSLHRIIHTKPTGLGAPLVKGLPEEHLLVAGRPATLHVEASGRPPLSYQWQRNETDVAAATGATLHLSRVRRDDHGARYRCVVSNALGTAVSRATTIWITQLERPIQVPQLTAGLRAASYPCDGSTLVDFSSLRPDRRAIVDEIAAWPRDRRGSGGFMLHGFIEVPSDGAYEFAVTSSGISKLFIDRREVVTTAGPPDGERTATGPIGLQAGLHRVLLLAVREAGHRQITLDYSVDQGEARRVDAAMLFHDPSRVGDLFVVASPDAASGHERFGLSQRRLATTLNVSRSADDLPPLLSQTGVFRSLTDLTPNPGVVPYAVNSPLWSDGAFKRRWMALPGDATIAFSPRGNWRFPAGTVLIKHFELGDEQSSRRRRLETRLLYVDHSGRGYGATYRWREDEKDAELLDDALSEEVVYPTASGESRLNWYFPSRQDCLICHNDNAFVLGVKTAQLDGDMTYGATGIVDNQIRTWNHLGLFDRDMSRDTAGGWPRLVDILDADSPLEDRVRSYLDANCAQCHRPAGVRAGFDARYETPLAQQELINGPLRAGNMLPGNAKAGRRVSRDFGIRGARVVAPGEPRRSMLYERMKLRHNVFSMPPLATNRVDERAVAVVEEWIRSLEAGGR